MLLKNKNGKLETVPSTTLLSFTKLSLNKIKSKSKYRYVLFPIEAKRFSPLFFPPYIFLPFKKLIRYTGPY